MPISTISPEKLVRLVGTHKCPVLIDLRSDEAFGADTRFIPASLRRRPEKYLDWTPQLAGRAAVIICQDGLTLSPGIAAALRHDGVPAETLEGGFEAWKKSGAVCVEARHLPSCDQQGRTLWVTRERPKVDRIACAWLIRRFVDPLAVFLFVPPAAVADAAAQMRAAPFDVPDVFWSHRGEKCTFDVMVEEFGLATEPLLRMARIIRGADTNRLDLAPEAAGLLAVSLGLSRMHADDLAQLEAGMTLYDAFYRWCRDAADETHVHAPARRGA
jgi:rhodanese-related sulfurtransferase